MEDHMPLRERQNDRDDLHTLKGVASYDSVLLDNFEREKHWLFRDTRN